MKWKVIEVPDADPDQNALTDSELGAIGVALHSACDRNTEKFDPDDVFFRAWRKLGPAIDKSNENGS